MTDGRIFIVNMDEVIGVINHSDDRLDLCFRNGMKQTVRFVGPWKNYPDIQNRDDEIQDLKLENDRLKRRNELMEDYIHAIACIASKKSKFKGLCDVVSCPYYDHNKGFGQGACQLGTRDLIEKEAADLIDKLEEL